MNELDRKRVFLKEDIFVGDLLIVLRLENSYAFEAGVRTKKVDGKFMEVVDTFNFEKYRIKMPINFEIAERTQFSVADFFGFSAKLYVRDNKIFWSIKADGIN